MKPNIISASRRTDIPAFYSEWFINRIRQGWGINYNPYNRQVACVSLKPEDVAAIVFWSKNYLPLFPYLDELDKRGFKLLFHFTITGLPASFEENVPSAKDTVEAFRFLARRFTPSQVLWRYDPIILTPQTDYNFHRQNFSRLCEELAGFTTRCYISYVHVYGKVARRLKSRNLSLADDNLQEKKDLAITLAKIARKYDLELFSCCNDFLWSNEIKKGRCIDANLLQSLFGLEASAYAVRPSRKECGCFESIDLGFYDTCLHLCLYCYANNREESVRKNYALHEAGYPALHKGINIKKLSRVITVLRNTP